MKPLVATDPVTYAITDLQERDDNATMPFARLLLRSRAASFKPDFQVGAHAVAAGAYPSVLPAIRV